jgi:Fic family protein
MTTRIPEFSSIEAWLGRARHTWDYSRELASRGKEYQPDQDVSSWIRFNLTAYHQQAQTVQKRLDRSSQVWRILAEFAERNDLDERTMSALHDVAVAGRVRRSRYEQAEGLSLQQAQRDLRDLVTARILAPVGRTRARYYQAGDRFPEDAAEIATTPMTLAGPYPA